MKRAAIIQSNYIPWKGYFDLIARVDEFILYDDVQYTKNDWRNRNLIKTNQGIQWLTIPILLKNKTGQLIKDTEICHDKWASQHWKTLKQYYSKAPYFKEVSVWLEPLYLQEKHINLSCVNKMFLVAICEYLKIQTKISYSWEYDTPSGKTERLVSLCSHVQAEEYVTGPSAKQYLDTSLFEAERINVVWMDYSGYKEYPQLHGDFAHNVSIVDVLFNCGEKSREYLKF